MKRRYGTHPDVPDVRDHCFVPPKRLHLPEVVDLRPHFPPPYEQGKLNSCSANAIAALIWYEERRRLSPRAPSPSRLFIYYNERAREHRVHGNVPVSLRDGYKTIARTGVCDERMWPYLVSRFRDRPRRRCYESAKSRRVVSYARVERKLQHMRAALAIGHPFTLGISVHESFESERMKRDGRAYLPKDGERLLGGHAVVVVGYHDAYERFIVRNSWGRKWGLQGYFTLPYEYLMHERLAWDFWMLRELQVELTEA